MLCQWCGMESASAARCSWCGRELSKSAPETSEAANASVKKVAPEPTPPVDEPADDGRAPWLVGGAQRPPLPAVPGPTAPANSGLPASPTGRPIIGVRRPGGTAPAGRVPAPAPSAPIARHVPAPPIPLSGGSRPAVSSSPAVASAPATSVVNRPGPISVVRTPLPLKGAAPLAPVAPSTAQPAAAAQPTVSAPIAVHTPEAPVEESGGLADGRVAANPPPATRINAPALGTFQAAKSKYYPGQVIDPVSGTHYDSESGAVTAAPIAAKPAAKEPEIVLNWDDENRNPIALGLGRYAGVFAGVLILAGLVAHALPKLWIAPYLIAAFVGAALLPVFRVVPWVDEDSDHVGIYALLTLVFGPAVALVIYGVIGAVRRDVNVAIFGMLIVALLTRGVCESAAGLGFSLARLSPFAHSGGFDLKGMALAWSALITVFGWHAGGLFHKLDE